MAFTPYTSETITNAGATISFSLETQTDGLLLKNAAALTLLGNVAVNFTGTAKDGQIITVDWYAGFTLNGNTFTINGISLSDLQALKKGRLVFQYVDGASPLWIYSYIPDLNGAGTITGLLLEDATLTLAKFPALTRGYIWAGDATGRPALLNAKTNAQILIGDGTDLVSVPVTGDIAITNAGVTSIGAGVIVNADINAAAAIAFSKLAALSPANILVGSAGNVPTSVAMSGDVTISNTGVTAIGASKVTNTMMADDSVTLTNLASTGQVYSYATTTATAANTTETTLASFAMGSAIGDADGDVLEVYAYGSFAATANNKSVRLRFGATLATATQLCINTTTAAPNGINWVVKAKLFRTGAASQKGQAEILFSGIAGELDNFTATETWSASTIYLSGQNGTAAANDIVLEGFEVKIARTNNN